MPREKPTIRVLTHLACTGGTVISRAIDAMPDTVIASEVHPLMGMRRRANPYRQLRRGYGIFDDDDLTRVFVREMTDLHERCESVGRVFIIRDHTHADFVEPGFASRSPVWLRTNRALEASFEVSSLVTVRHPIDQWLSLEKNKWLDSELPEFIARLLKFAEHATAAGFERYEDFTADPDSSLRRMCEALGVSFDASFRSRLADSGVHLTGGSGRRSTHIEPRPRADVARQTLDAFEATPGYGRLLELLGYLHPAGVLSRREVSAA